MLVSEKMTGSFTSNSARLLVWDTEIPNDYFKRNSPVFYFQNSEWCFELRTCEGTHYCLDMVNTSQLKLAKPKPFKLTCYIDYKGSPLSFVTTNIGSANNCKVYFLQKYPNQWIDLREKGKIKIVMIFHDEVGSTLRLASEKEKFRNVAVGTGDCTLERLSSDFSKLLDENLYQDVELLCEDRTFKAHKNVLSTRSKVFLAMLQTDMLEGHTAKIEVKDMKSDVCNLLLRYMYSGKVSELTPESARGLYESADRYNVGGLMKPCAELLAKNLTPDNACEMLVLADAHSDQNFKETIIEYILVQNIPRNEDTWQDFCCCHPMLANQVLNKYYKLNDNK